LPTFSTYRKNPRAKESTLSSNADVMVEVPVATTTAPPAQKRANWLLIALIAGYLIQIAWRLYLDRKLIVPGAHADEDSYLITARALAGGPGGPSTENAVFRRVGYPMLLSPIYWFTHDAFQVYRGAQVINALINALMFPLAYLFGRRVLAIPRRSVALAAAFAAAAIPAVVFYGEFAMTDAIIAALGLGWLLLVHRWLTAPTARARLIAAVGAGLDVGFIYLIHVRGTVLVAIHGLLVLTVLGLRRSRLRVAVGTVLGATFMVGLDLVLKLSIRHKMTLLGHSPKSQTEQAVTTLHGFVRAVSDGAGQLWVLGVATFGLGAVGLAATAWSFLRYRTLGARLRDPQEGGRLIVLGTALFATLFIAVSSAAALPPSDLRMNYHAYPRYIHFLVPIWLLVGVAALARASSRRHLLGLAAAGLGTLLVPAAIVYTKVHTANPLERFMSFDAPETSFLAWNWDKMRVAQPTIIAVLAFAVLLGLVYGRSTRFVAFAALTVVFGVMMWFTTERISWPLVNFQYLGNTPRLVSDAHLGPGDVIAESTRIQWYWPYNHAREDYWNTLVRWDSYTQPVPPQCNVAIAPSDGFVNGEGVHVDWDGTTLGWHRIADDPVHHWAVWRRS
jgi:hypothetical protein